MVTGKRIHELVKNGEHGRRVHHPHADPVPARHCIDRREECGKEVPVSIPHALMSWAVSWISAAPARAEARTCLQISSLGKLRRGPGQNG